MTTNASVGWWSLYTDPGGGNLFFSGQTNNGSGGLYNSTPIGQRPNRMHLSCRSYSPTNSFFQPSDGSNAAARLGSGVAYWPGLNVQTNGLWFGSASNGFSQIHGDLDDVSTYNFQADGVVGGTYGVFSIPYGVTASFDLPGAPSTPTITPTFRAVTGAGFLHYVGASSLCVSNVQVYLI